MKSALAFVLFLMSTNAAVIVEAKANSFIEGNIFKNQINIRLILFPSLLSNPL